MKKIILIITLLISVTSCKQGKEKTNYPTENRNNQQSNTKTKYPTEGLTVQGIVLEGYDTVDLDYQKPENVSIEYLLCMSISECDIKLFRQIHGKKTLNPETKCENGTLIIKATSCDNSTEMVAKLIEKGFDINSSDEEGSNLFQYAVLFDNHELVNYLIKNKADIFSKNEYGENAVFSCETVKMAKKLEMLGFNVNEVSNENNNLLHYAAEDEEMIELAKYLIFDKKLNFSLKNDEGLTPIDLARDNENIEFLKLVKLNEG